MRATRHRSAGARGQMLPLVGLAMIGVIGVAALAIDAGRGYLDRRTLQSSADAAALSGASEIQYQMPYTRSRTDLTYMMAAAIQEAVNNLPGTSVPQSPNDCRFSNAGTTTWCGIDATTGAGTLTGLSLGNGYTVDVVGTVTSVAVTLHHSIPLTLGSAAGFGQNVSISATATAVNYGLPFALVLFRTNCSSGAGCANLTFSGSGTNLTFALPSGTTDPPYSGDAMSNEGVCPSPAKIDFGSTGAQYTYNQAGAGACGDTTNIINQNPATPLTKQYPQVPDPNYYEYPAPTGPGTAIGQTTNSIQCLAPGTYNSWNVTKGTLILEPGVFRLKYVSGAQHGINDNNFGTIRTMVSTDTNACPSFNGGVVPADTGVQVQIVPEGANGASSTLSVGAGATFQIHGSPTYRNISLYIEKADTTGTRKQPCDYTTSGCGSQVVSFGSGGIYNVGGVIYGYGDNMSFGGGAGGTGVGQVFAWTMKVNGNGTLVETYDPSQVTSPPGLVN